MNKITSAAKTFSLNKGSANVHTDKRPLADILAERRALIDSQSNTYVKAGYRDPNIARYGDFNLQVVPKKRASEGDADNLHIMFGEIADGPADEVKEWKKEWSQRVANSGSLQDPQDSHSLGDVVAREIDKCGMDKLSAKDKPTARKSVFVSRELLAALTANTQVRMTDPDESDDEEEKEAASALEGEAAKKIFEQISHQFEWGFMVVKVSKNGTKFLRHLKVTPEALVLTTMASKSEMIVHLSHVTHVSLGCESTAFENLIHNLDGKDVAPDLSVCSVISIDDHSESLLFPTEGLRNAFVLVLRVKTQYIVK